MLAARRGDPGALDLLVQKHRGRIRRFVYRVVRDEAISEELAQEVFLRVHRNRRKYRATAKFTSWIYQIANHLALNWIRDHEGERRLERLDAHPTGYYELRAADMRVDDWLVRQVTLDEVRTAVAELPERQRTVVRLHKFEEMECAEIGSRLGCSNQAVRSLLCRAYKALHQRLAHLSPGESAARSAAC